MSNIKIALMRSSKATLPEIDIYYKYFNKLPNFTVNIVNEEDRSSLSEYDVLWNFMGVSTSHPTQKNQILIHEYTSLSTPPFVKVKNILKRLVNTKPDLRIFQNEIVKNEMNFKDFIPYIYRDMGIDERFLINKKVEKKYDFIYIGSMDNNREIDKLLEQFSKTTMTIALLGKKNQKLINQFKGYKNIYFLGSVPYSEVPEIARQATYGINYIPDVFPYNVQTSTKLLEYLALDLKVISTDYKWVREFECKNNCAIYKIDDIENIDFKKIINFSFNSVLNMENYSWEKILLESKIDKVICNLVDRRKNGEN